jgi:hypothetical protein
VTVDLLRMSRLTKDVVSQFGGARPHPGEKAWERVTARKGLMARYCPNLPLQRMGHCYKRMRLFPNRREPRDR